ncbi:MAG TPA: cytochrome c oxidase subunit 3 [Verrucomicrobiae bacterium]|nr:cytochrome c oxidase subunit 3 [Verrucomicrobiae bacterium]
MDIPYTIEARPDTGLYNAKVGIWLFLASEVMLFGALFSAYILLRVGSADGYWPHGWLNIPLGTVNTLVLITSSITTVMAWASCKMNQFGKFKLFHACTLLCALMFLGIKSYEYHDKLTHYEFVLKDGTFADGHIVKNQLTQQPGGLYTGYALIKGRKVEDERELYDLRAHKAGPHEELRIEGPQIVKMGSYGPWHNTYTALYFTLTGLHALHVIGGALVIGFLWGPGSRMWKSDPERFTNRVEISGLFWHFVDLVWIFLFPILYLL